MQSRAESTMFLQITSHTGWIKFATDVDHH